MSTWCWSGSITTRVTGLDLTVCAGHAVQICCEEDLSEMWKSPGVTGYARGHRADPYAIDPQVYLSLYPLLVCPLKSTQDLPTSRVQNLESDIGSHPWIFPWFCHGCTPRSTLEPKDPLLSLDPISGSVPWTHPQIWLWTLPLDPALDPFLSMDLPLGLLWIWTCWIFSWRLNLDLPLNPLFDPPWISPGSFLDLNLLDPLLELDLTLLLDALWMLPRWAPGSPLDSLVPPWICPWIQPHIWLRYLLWIPLDLLLSLDPPLESHLRCPELCHKHTDDEGHGDKEEQGECEHVAQGNDDGCSHGAQHYHGQGWQNARQLWGRGQVWMKVCQILLNSDR